MKSKSNTEEIPLVHRHKGQQRFLMRMAAINYLVIPRGWGKTTGPMADFCYQNVFTMPRSSGTFVAKSYAQAISATLPPLFNGFEKLGLIKDVHFRVGSYFPKESGVPRPHVGPLKGDHVVHFCNGSIINISSQDRNSVADNGKSSDWGVIDEAKMIDYKRLQEEFIIPMRGNMDLFGKLWNHHSILYCSDMPDDMDHWLLKAESVMNENIIKIGMGIRAELYATKVKLMKSKSIQMRQMHQRKVDALENTLNEVLKGEVMFMEGDSTENIHVLGLDYFQTQSRILSPRKYLRSFHNYRISANEYFFYPLFDESEHTYTDADYNHLDDMGLNQALLYKSDDCRHDLDVLSNRPLTITSDANANFNCMVVWQEHDKTLKALKEIYVSGENSTTKANAKAFCEYYKTHKNKIVYFVYDQTFIPASARTTKGVNFKQDYVDELRKNGWRVIEEYIGKQPTHKSRYRLIKMVMDEDGKGKFPRLRVNSLNCPNLVGRLKDTPRVLGTDDIKKDKDSEKKADVPGEKATHLTDAFDTGIIFFTRSIDESGDSYQGIGIV